MGSFANKTQDKSRSAADSSAKQPVSSAALQFVSKRPEAVAQRKIQAAADSSVQSQQQQAIQLKADSRAANNSQIIQFDKWTGALACQTRGPVLPRGAAELRDFARFEPGSEYRKDTGALTAADIAEYSLLGGAVATGGGGSVASLISSADFVSPGAKISGGISGGLGALGDLRAGYKTGKEAYDSGNSRTTRKIAFGDTMGSLASATKGGATATLNFSEYAGAGLTAAATTTAGVAGIASGAADIVTGAYGAHKAGKRGRELNRLQAEHGVDADTKLAAQIGSATQGRERIKGVSKVLKGVAGVVGGGMLLAAATTPIGWIVLTAGAGIAAAAAAINYVKKRYHKEEMAAAILGVKDDWRGWKAATKRNEKKSWWRSQKRQAGIDDIGPNPLTVALSRGGYKDPGHAVNNYVQTVSLKLHADLARGNMHSMALLRNIGLDVDRNPDSITPEKIARKLMI